MGVIAVIALIYALGAQSTIELVYADPAALDSTQKLTLVGFYVFGKVAMVAVLWWMFVVSHE